MMTPTPPRFTPPNTANWTGRSPRTSTEAFGAQWHPEPPAPPAPPNRYARVVLVVLVLCILAGLALIGAPR